MESTLNQTYTDLQGQVGYWAGWGRGALLGDNAWSTKQQQTIDDCLRSGLRRFYYCTPPYDWSFLQPITEVTLPVNQTLLRLPDDFGGLNGVITINSVLTGTQLTWVLQITGESTLRQAYQVTPSATGRPVMAALQAIKGTGPTESSRTNLYIYPIPDQEYLLQIPYFVNPDYLTGALPYAYGGAQHYETLKSAVLAAAEEIMDDAATTWNERFKERIAASINADRRNKPQLVGYNGDRSDLVGKWRRSDYHGWGSIMVNGVVPGPPI